VTATSTEMRRGPVRRILTVPARAALRALGYDVVSLEPAPPRLRIPPDADPFTASLIECVAPYTLTTPDRIIGLVGAVRHVVAAGVLGAFAECGVWRGGSAMAIARTLLELGISDRDLYLYDTFDEIPEPVEHDVIVTGESVAELLAEARGVAELQHLPQEELERALKATGYPWERFRIVSGLVEETLPAGAPERLALCRLDTDLYESTAHELTHLWPRLSPGGIMIIDDYGDFLGARKAVDEYLAQLEVPIMLHRLDTCARLIVKPGEA